MVNCFLFSVAITTFVLCDELAVLRCSILCLSVVMTADKVLKVGFHPDLGVWLHCQLNFTVFKVYELQFSCSVWTQEGSDLPSLTRSDWASAGWSWWPREASAKPQHVWLGLLEPANLFCGFATRHLSRFCYWCHRSVILEHRSFWRTQPTCPWWARSHGWPRRWSRVCPCLKPVTPSPLVWWVRFKTLLSPESFQDAVVLKATGSIYCSPYQV